jgi:Tol biopolymer transport system component
MGPAAYMSPEQARGQEVDKQADIWAFGAVVFEMLSGRMAFPGATVTDVMAAVVAQEPEWSALPAETPWNVTELLRLCLTKDPRQRIHDIADARLRLTSSAIPTSESAAPADLKSRSQIFPWVLVALLAAIATFFAFSTPDKDDRVAPVQRFSINLPPELFVAAAEPMALSPDGSKLVLVGYEDGVKKLILRHLDTAKVAPIPATEAAENPFFSPDGESIGFTRDDLGELHILSLATGRASMIAKADWGGASWGPDETIVFTPHYTSGLHRIPVRGGTPEELTSPDLEQGELGHFWPQHLPGGGTIIFTNFSVPLSRSKIEAYDLVTGETTTLVENGVWGRYASTGHLLFIRDQTLMATTFETNSLQVSGAPVPVLTDLIPDIGQGDTPVVLAENGTLAYIPGALMNPPRQLVWVDRQGLETPFPETHRYKYPKISPDGSRVALTIEDKSWDLWALELERGTLSRLSFEPNTQFGAIWMPAGDQILYGQDDPPYNIYRRPADGGGQAAAVVTSSVDTEPRSISPDGKVMLYSRSTNDSGYDLWLQPLEGDLQPQPWLATPFNEDLGSFSPDGRWVVYTSDETGKLQVYVNRFPDGGRKLQVSLAGGTQPLWARHGRELYFREGPRMMAVDVTTGDRFTAGEPVELFAGTYMASANKWDYDVAHDGRFIMIKTPDEDRPREINVVLNWFQELENLVPMD